MLQYFALFELLLGIMMTLELFFVMMLSRGKSSFPVKCSRVSINLSVWLLIGPFSIVLQGPCVTGCQEPILFIFSILGNIQVWVLRRIVQYCQGQFTVPNNPVKVLFTSIMTQLAALMVKVILEPFNNSLLRSMIDSGRGVRLSYSCFTIFDGSSIKVWKIVQFWFLTKWMNSRYRQVKIAMVFHIKFSFLSATCRESDWLFA